MSHVRVWKFKPPRGREHEFFDAYSGTGQWAKLFGKAPGFRDTTLMQPTEPGDWWLTLDRWDSVADFNAFQANLGHEYHTLDAELEGVAGEEEFVGAFEVD